MIALKSGPLPAGNKGQPGVSFPGLLCAILRYFAFSGALEGCEIIESTKESHSEERNGVQEVEGSTPFGSTSPKELTSDELSHAVTGCG